MWAACTTSSATARSTPGTWMLSVTWMPKPFGIGPMPTSESIFRSAGSAIFFWPATNFIAPMKQAA